jgi:hypothetical protein
MEEIIFPFSDSMVAAFAAPVELPKSLELARTLQELSGWPSSPQQKLWSWHNAITKASCFVGPILHGSGF